MEDILIIGAGTAGMTAAIYARRAGLSCTVFESAVPGGKIVNSPEVANYPGLPKVSGYDYAMALLEQVKSYSAEIKYETVIGSELFGTVKKLKTSKGEYDGKTVIIANGASRKKLGCKGENEFEGRGVSYCATCDGAFFRDKTVAVIGGGSTAFEDAQYLAGICERVFLVVRGEDFSTSDILVESVLKNDKITVLKNSEVVEITGENFVTGIKIKNTESEAEKTISVSAVFVAVGIAPDNSIFGSALKLDERGYIISGEDCLTGIDGVFVAGDTRQKELRQLVTAASDGAVAATAALKYIRKSKKEQEQREGL